MATCALALTLVAGWRLHKSNRERAVTEFQDHQLRTADALAAALRAELTGAARAVRAIATGIDSTDDAATVHAVIEQQTRCGQSPCAASIAVYDASGGTIDSTAESPHLTADEIQNAVAWARDPANAKRVETLIPSSSPTALVVVTPAVDAGIVAAQVDFGAFLPGLDRAASSRRAQGATMVLDGRGNVIVHTSHPPMQMDNVLRPRPRCGGCHESFQDVERMLAMKHGVLAYASRGIPQLGAVAPLAFEGEQWVAAMTAPADSAVAVLSADLWQLGLVGGVALAAFGVATQLMWKNRRRRLEADVAAHRASLEHSHTELTALNARLESALVEWRATVDTIDAAVLVLEPSGRVERMNRAAAETLPGAPWSWLGRPSDQLRAHAPWDSALELARQAIDRGTIAASRAECADRTWDLWCRTPQAGGRGSVVIVARDVTTVVQLQESLRRSETMAALGEVVAGVAHEVRNPLFAISSMVDAISVQKDRDVQPFLGPLREEVGRLKTLMTDLLEYGRPGKSVLQPQSLTPVVGEAIRSCTPRADGRAVGIALRNGTDVDLWMDSRRLLRVFINVIENAVQHAPSGTSVTVDVHPDSNRAGVEVRIRDEGPGFAAEDLPRVFTPFFTRRAGGFGLGLAISERIVGEHRGCITAANDPAGGAVVTVALPLTAPPGATRVSQGALPC